MGARPHVANEVMKKILMTLMAVSVCVSPALAKHKNKQKPIGDEVEWKNVPAPVQATVQSAAPGGKVLEVRRETKNNVVIYSAEVKTSDGKMETVAVTDAGKLLKVKEDRRKKHNHKPLFG